MDERLAGAVLPGYGISSSGRSVIYPISKKCVLFADVREALRKCCRCGSRVMRQVGFVMFVSTCSLLSFELVRVQ